MIKRNVRTATGLLASVALAAGAAVLFTPSPAHAAGPIGGPLCGPTYQWSCSGPGGPKVLFIGTVCDRAAFERRTGYTCVPF